MPDGIKKVFATRLDRVYDQDREGLGTIRFEGGNVYKWVKIVATANISAGDALCYNLTDTNLQTVDRANSAVGAGIAMAAVASGATKFGWIQTRGLATLANTIAGTSPAAGNAVTNTGAAAGVVTKAAAVTDCIVGYIVHAANKIVALSYPN